MESASLGSVNDIVNHHEAFGEQLLSMKVALFKPSERACASMLEREGERAFHMGSVASFGCWSSLCLPILGHKEYCFVKDEN